MAVGEWDQRQLCPDGGCVGVIGPDGTCKVCGRAAQNWGDERNRGLIDPPDEDPDEDDEDTDDAGDAADEADEASAGDANDEDNDEDSEDDADDEDDGDDEDAPDASDLAAASAASPSEWTSRTLCPDGGCVGVIGPDGRCKVCGRAASGSSPASAPAAGIATEPAHADVPRDAASAPDSPPRARCSDANCPGTSGPDGHCEVCGKVVP